MLPRTKRSFMISESSVDETSLRGQRCDPSVRLNRFHWNKFLVFSHAVMIVNLFESFCCHLKCLSLIMALFLYNPQNNVLKSLNRKSEMRIFEFILDSFKFEDVLYPSRYLIKSSPLVKMLVFDSGTSGWQPDSFFSVALPMEGPVSPESYPTGTENGKPRFVTHRETMRSNFWLPWNSDEQAAFQLFAQPVRWTSSLGQMLMIAWQCCDDDAHDKKSPGICLDATCPWDVNLQRLICWI